MKKNLFFLIIIFVICIFILEILIFNFMPQNLSSSWRVYGNNGLLLNKKNITAVHKYNNKEVNYKFGNFHNRTYEQIEQLNSNQRDKILVLGDSFTFGWLIKDENTYIYKLANFFKKYYFINASAGGWGMSDQLSYFEDYCLKIKPRYTLIFINNYDLERSKVSNLYYLENGMLKRGKNQIVKLKKILNESKIYDFLIQKSQLVNIIKNLYLKISIRKKQIELEDITNDRINGKKIFLLADSLILKFKIIAKQCGSNVLFINLAWENYNDNKRPTSLYFKKKYNFFEDNGLILIDLNEEMKNLRKNKSQNTLDGDDHPNKKANNFIYEILYPKLIEYIN